MGDSVKRVEAEDYEKRMKIIKIRKFLMLIRHLVIL